MKKTCVIIFTLTYLTLYALPCWSQGCSDAGFCTMGAMKPDQRFKRNIPLRLRSIELSFYRGTTLLSPIVYVSTLDVNFNFLDDKTFFQVKIPYQMVRGNLGKTSALSDLSLCLTRLVTLSACQTGLGKIEKGEGVIGLSRALVYAGTGNLIVSFWNVADQSTAMLMKDFYTNVLATQVDYSEALRHAKLGLMKSEKYAAPFYWAPFVLIGF